MTVAELIEVLKGARQDLEVVSTAVDCGGYDAIHTTTICTYFMEPNQLYVGGKDED